MNTQEATPNNNSAKTSMGFWKFCAIVLPFYTTAVVFAVALALQAQERGVPAFPSVIYGASVGAIATYYTFRYAFGLLTFLRRQFKRFALLPSRIPKK